MFSVYRIVSHRHDTPSSINKRRTIPHNLHITTYLGTYLVIHYQTQTLYIG